MASPLTPDNPFFSTTPSPDGDVPPALTPNSPGPQTPRTTMDHSEYLNWCSEHLLREFISRDPGLHQEARQWSRANLEELFHTQRRLLQELNQPHREDREPSALAGIAVTMAYSCQLVLNRERNTEHKIRQNQGTYQIQLMELEQRLQTLCQQRDENLLETQRLQGVLEQQRRDWDQEKREWGDAHHDVRHARDALEVDARYMFRIVDVGAFGKNSDGGVLSCSAFGRALRQGSLDLPEDTTLPGAEDLGAMPHVIVGDAAFPLRRNMMRPFPGHNIPRERRIFNYRLSRARRVVENAFGHLSTQWRMYRRVLGLQPENAEAAVKATCILHNYLTWDTPTEGFTRENTEPQPAAIRSITRISSNHPSREAVQMRERFCSYFSSPAGSLPYQYNVV
ncbi:hypothetical protein SKAU_G00246630 [Synaphobranchus kaupii]|uniref:DDE Tnp4 domain-containing protein n=1 Tax=Synaphobranchus kaupii TaxID=118154 RepID=A0A9Q1F204_SYNKA|nr:hypothetical protein SKAU_G00246630 [Synaphobranchus kaupii]